VNGIFDEGEMRHIAHWQSVKLVDKSEEEEDAATVIIEKERFSNELTLVFCTGEIHSEIIGLEEKGRYFWLAS
jgi:hypothetical protein